MREPHLEINHEPDCVQFQSLLYIAGELEGAELTQFEKRLGEDQEARDALCHAMGLTVALSGHKTFRPDPAYRAVVRKQLFPAKGFWQSWVQPNWTHPAVWTATGALVLLVTLSLARPRSPLAGDRGVSSPVADAVQKSKHANNDESKDLPSPEAATFWSELPNGEHLSKAREDDQRRKDRVQDFHNLSKPTIEKVHKSGLRPAVPSVK